VNRNSEEKKQSSSLVSPGIEAIDSTATTHDPILQSPHANRLGRSRHIKNIVAFNRAVLDSIATT
jgi:hypothetical protein